MWIYSVTVFCHPWPHEQGQDCMAAVEERGCDFMGNMHRSWLSCLQPAQGQTGPQRHAAQHSQPAELDVASRESTTS